MVFGLGKNIAVLESKLDIYEDLSKEMLDKLERAVSSIKENSNKVAIILERHENRLDESERTDKLILNMVEDIKNQNYKEHEEVKEKMKELEIKIGDISRFRWIIAGIAIASVFVIQSSNFFGKILTHDSGHATVQVK